MTQVGSDSTLTRPRAVTVIGWIAIVQAVAGLLALIYWVFALHGNTRYLMVGPQLGLGFAAHFDFGLMVKNGPHTLSHELLWLVCLPLGSAFAFLDVAVGRAMLRGRSWGGIVYVWTLISSVVGNLVLWGSVEFVGIVYLCVVYRLLNQPRVRDYFGAVQSNCGGQACAES